MGGDSLFHLLGDGKEFHQRVVFPRSSYQRLQNTIMKLAILGGRSSWHTADLLRAAAGRHRACVATLKSLRATLSGGSVRVESEETDLSACDGVIVRAMPPGSLEQVVLRMDVLARLEGQGVRVLNPPRAIESAVDKFLTSSRLLTAGVPIPDTVACQSAADALHGFHQLGGDVVLKPIFGGEGRGITRLQDADLAERAFKMVERLGGVLYLQRFVPHRGHDLRLLVIGERVLGIARHNPSDWRTNLSRGGKAAPIEVKSELRDLALRCAASVGAPLAGVDLLPALDGSLYALEVNAVPGWRGLSQANGIDVARLVIDLLCE